MYRALPLSFFRWCAHTAVGQYIGQSLWGFAILETVHILGLTLLLGSVFVLNLTVLGLGMKTPAKKLVRDLAPVLLAGLFLSLASGIPMFMSAAVGYAMNPAMTVKLVLLAAALVIQLAIHLVPGMYDGTRLGRTAACVSILFWFGIAYAGRAIAFGNLIGS
jgi:hypothetical protein